MDNIAHINVEIKKGAKKNSSEFLEAYLKNEDAVIDLLNKFSGIKSEIYLQNIDNSLSDYIRFSAIFSDITLLNTTPSSVNNTNISYFNPQHKYFRERKVTIPANYLYETGTDSRRFLPCYTHRNDEEIRKLFTKYKALVKENKLLIRPLRSMYVNFPEQRQGTLYYVNPNTLNDHWYIDDNKQYDFITIDNGVKVNRLITLFNITLPFIQGVDIDVLAKIIVDETDLLSSFRLALKKLTNQAGENNSEAIKEIQQDVLQPEIDKLQRKFNRIKNSHRLGVGVSMGSFALTLSLGSLVGANILASLGTSVASAFTGIMIAENNYQDKIDTLKDNPYYLLWQIQRRI